MAGKKKAGPRAKASKKAAKAAVQKKASRKTRSPQREKPSRSDRGQQLKRCLAVAEVLRTGRANAWYTAAELAALVTERYPAVFDKKPSIDTVQRMMKGLVDSVPIKQSTAGEAGLVQAGDRTRSATAIVWRYAPEQHIDDAVELSGLPEILAALIDSAVLIEAARPLDGLSLYDTIQNIKTAVAKLNQNPQATQDVTKIAGRYQLGGRKKKQSSFERVRAAQREQLRVIEGCVRDGVRLRIIHKQAYGQTRDIAYEVEPRALKQRNASLFLICHVIAQPGRTQHANLRQFKIDRITKAERLSEKNSLGFDENGNLTGRKTFRGEALPDITPVLQRIEDTTIHDYLPRSGEQPLEDIEIEVTKEVANWVCEEKINPQQRESHVKAADGTAAMRVTIKSAYLRDIGPRIVGLGEFVRVLSPPELVDHVHERLSKAARQYESKAGEGGKPLKIDAATASRGPRV
jgi:hypothetical protein